MYRNSNHSFLPLILPHHPAPANPTTTRPALEPVARPSIMFSMDLTPGRPPRHPSGRSPATHRLPTKRRPGSHWPRCCGLPALQSPGPCPIPSSNTRSATSSAASTRTTAATCGSAPTAMRSCGWASEPRRAVHVRGPGRANLGRRISWPVPERWSRVRQPDENDAVAVAGGRSPA